MISEILENSILNNHAKSKYDYCSFNYSCKLYVIPLIKSLRGLGKRATL